MKIVCTQENLKAGFGVVGKIISPSNTLPILNNVLLKTENGVLKISSTNLEIAITTQIRCKVEEEGELTVNAKTIMELVGNLPNKNININSKTGILEIQTENYNTNIKTLPPEDFPLIPAVDNNKTIEIDPVELKNNLDVVMFASSSNQTQPEISGVLIKIKNNQIIYAATDRYRLAEKTMSLNLVDEDDREIILPHKTAVEISRLCSSYTEKVIIGLTESQVVFNFNDTQLTSRLVDGQFPEYKEIIPTEFLTKMLVVKNDLISAIKTASIFSHNTNSVMFEYLPDAGKLILTAEAGDLGRSVVEVEAEIAGEKGGMLLNYRYVIDALNVMESDKVEIKVIDSSSPAVFFPSGDKGYLYLVMPIKN